MPHHYWLKKNHWQKKSDIKWPGYSFQTSHICSRSKQKGNILTIVRPFSGHFGKIAKLSNWDFFAQKSNDLGKMGKNDALNLLTFYKIVIILWLFHTFFLLNINRYRRIFSSHIIWAFLLKLIYICHLYQFPDFFHQNWEFFLPFLIGNGSFYRSLRYGRKSPDCAYHVLVQPNFRRYNFYFLPD